MTKKYKISFLQLIVMVSVITGSFFFIPNTSRAAEEGLSRFFTIQKYKPLAPLPSNFFPEKELTLPGYLRGMFKLLIALAGLLSVIMIVIGGIQYMSTDAISGKSEGKERITNAVLGLILALVSWIILYTINPDLLEFKLFTDGPTAQTSTAPQAVSTPIDSGSRTNNNDYTITSPLPSN